MKNGVLEREILWRASESGVVKARFRRLVSMAQPHLAALEVTLTALTNPVELGLETGIDTAIPSPSFPVWNPLRWTRPSRARLGMEAGSIDGAHRLWVETSLRGPGRFEMIRDPHHPPLCAPQTRLDGWAFLDLHQVHPLSNRAITKPEAGELPDLDNIV